MVESDDTLLPIVPTPTSRARRTAYVRAAAAMVVLGFTTVPTFVRRFEVAEPSMSPTLEPGDYLISVKPKRLEVGDIVIFSSPGDPSFFLVKRVIALGDSRVKLDQGTLTVDGTESQEPWSHGQGRQGVWKVARDEVFVLGDDRSLSAGDSATLGPLRVKAIDSIVRFRYWPPARIGLIRH